MVKKIKITDELKYTTEKAIEAINEKLQSIHAPQIALHDDPVNRAIDYVEFEKWLRDAAIEDIHSLIADFGLLPAVLAITGIDVSYAMSLQKSEDLQLSGYVRYIRASILYITDGKTSQIRTVAKSYIGDDFKLGKQREMVNAFTSAMLTRFINTTPGLPYVEAVGILTLMSE